MRKRVECQLGKISVLTRVPNRIDEVIQEIFQKRKSERFFQRKMVRIRTKDNYLFVPK
jgi:hypothetical protein